jgi:1,4-alpha-glucan branching enzyme
LTLAEPGGGSSGILVGRPLLKRDPVLPEKALLHQVTTRSEGTATVEIQLEAPEGARRVQVVGDFSFWEPMEMERDGARWSLRLEIPYGVHHYGFLVDEEWFLPEDAPDGVPDEWGRRNATMVIEGSIPAPHESTSIGAEGEVGK